MKNILFVAQFIISIVLIASILLQAKGTGLGTAWGGGGEFYHSKRGAEKILYLTTIVVAALFLILTLANTLLNLK